MGSQLKPYPRVRVCILTVGTEITDGQIFDRNSKWIAEAALDLMRFECEVVEHRSVPDDRAKIQESLTSLCRQAEIVFVTGGLGPTSDDFTREEIAGFTSAKLEWSKESWDWIQSRLLQRGAPISENQKQQSYFPKGSVLLKNSQGTAFGFWLEVDRKLGPPNSALGSVIIGLPGPPQEIRAIWNEGLHERLGEFANRWRGSMKLHGFAPRARNLHIIRTMGIGEGALANGIESILSDLKGKFAKESRLTLGYRANVPYVEVKVWSEPDDIDFLQALLDQIRNRYRSLIVNEGTDDVADGFIDRIVKNEMRKFKTLVIDEVTDGAFFKRIQERAKLRADAGEENHALLEAIRQDLGYFQGHRSWTQSSATVLSIKESAKTETFFIEHGSNSRELVLRVGAEARVLELPALASTLTSERGCKWATEIALREWAKSQ